jgi:hypothetical protein
MSGGGPRPSLRNSSIFLLRRTAMFGKENDTSPVGEAKEPKISRELAESEFIRYLDANGIDHDEAGMNEGEKESFFAIKRRFVSACMKGQVEVDEKKLKYTISNFSPEAGRTIVITRPAGKALMAMDGYKDGQNVGKLQAFLGSMTGEAASFFTKLDIVDWFFFRDIAICFLSV